MEADNAASAANKALREVQAEEFTLEASTFVADDVEKVEEVKPSGGNTMKSCLIKLCSRPGSDPKVFRAYVDKAVPPVPLGSLNIQVSTTGNEDYGVLRCAAKAFTEHTEPGADLDEIETRIAVTTVRAYGLWRATLEVKP